MALGAGLTLADHPDLYSREIGDMSVMGLPFGQNGGSASLLLPQGSITFGDLSAEVTGPG